MSQPKTKPKTISDGKSVHGVVAEFTDVDSLLAACRRVRDAGYKKADAFTPFPVHHIDEALGIKPTVLPWIALAAGLTGTTIALLMQISMNGDWIDDFSYPYIISGKPFVSLPAFIPVTFELTILLASFGTFFGMWALNGLPKFSNPMFTSPRFDRVTDDTFVLFLDAKDDRFDEAGAKALLTELGGQFVEPVLDDDSPSQIPKGILIALAATIALSFIPALVVARMRVTKSGMPRFHVFPDMDFSPAKDAQQVSTLFVDGRSARPDVPGTVSRDSMDWNLDFQTGIDMEKLASMNAPGAERLVAKMQSDVPTEGDEPPATAAAAESTTEASAEPKIESTSESAAAPPDDADAKADTPMAVEPALDAEADTDESEPETQADTDEAAVIADDAAAAVDTTPWLSENPLAINAVVLAKGQEQFNIYCAACHGVNGRGNGLVHQRAQKILATTWTPPSNMHDESLYSDVYPDGKLFSTITNGIRKMPGYAGQIKAKDRWAIVSYVRALQASQNASLDEVPSNRRGAVEKEQAEVKRKLEAAAKAEAEKAKAAADAVKP